MACIAMILTHDSCGSGEVICVRLSETELLYEVYRRWVWLSHQMLLCPDNPGWKCATSLFSYERGFKKDFIIWHNLWENIIHWKIILSQPAFYYCIGYISGSYTALITVCIPTMFHMSYSSKDRVPNPVYIFTLITIQVLQFDKQIIW